MIRIIGLKGIPIPVKKGDDLASLTFDAAREQGTPLEKGDVVVFAQTVVSKAEGRTASLKDVIPSEFAENVASRIEKDPRIVEVILRESRSIRRMGDGHLIAETRHGFVCANAGVDKSNVADEDVVTMLPEDPDRSARQIRKALMSLSGKDVAVLITDTWGRPFRHGQINVAIGVAGMNPIRDRRGEKDLFGYTLKVKQTAVADELAAAAELVIGQGAEGVPVAIIRGYGYIPKDRATARKLLMPREKDLFI